MNSRISHIVLGTAQWGTPYGITNVKGELSDSEIAAVVQVALNSGIAGVDTHRASNPDQGYGDAQTRLNPWAGQFAITTKVFAGSSADAPILDQITMSLADLGVDSVHACLVHDWYDLTDSQAEAAVHSLMFAQDLGIVDRLGVSAYSSSDLERAYECFGGSLGAVQAPCSVLDQRLCDSQVVELLRARGTEIQVRSIFLQGLLLDSSSRTRLAQHASVANFHRFCADRGLTPLQTSLSFIRSQEWVNRVVVGVTSALELAQIVETWCADLVIADWAALSSDEPDLLDPRRWAQS